jgi:hypothetical protein
LHSETIQKFTLDNFRAGLEDLFTKGVIQPLPTGGADMHHHTSAWSASPLSLSFPTPTSNSSFSSVWMLDYAPIEISPALLHGDSVEEMSSFIQHSLKCPTWIKTWVNFGA